MSKTVLMVLNQKFPDIRVVKEYNVLKKNGYRVVILASEEGEDFNDYEVIRLKSANSIRTKIFKNILKVDPVMVSEVNYKLRLLGINKVDIIHVHDLKWGHVGLYLKEMYKAKLIIDFHENYPELIDQFWKENNKINLIDRFRKRFLFNKNRLIKFENIIVEECDKFIVVVPEALERFKNNNYIDKAEIVSNTEDPNDWRYLPVEISENKKTVVSYIGGVGMHRGIDTVIEGMMLLNKEQYVLNVVGVDRNNNYTKKLIDYVYNNNLNNVNFIEWVPFEEVSEYIYKSHICLVPHNNNGHTQTTVPHKLFQYMSMGRPVLVSSVRPLKRIVEDTGSGLVFEADNSFDFADKLKLMNNHDERIEWGKNGRKAVEESFNWQKDADKLKKLYEDIINGLN